MTETADGHYFAGRELAERVMSSRSTDRRVAAAHEEFADRYEALAVVFGAKCPSGVGFQYSPSIQPPEPSTPSTILATEANETFPTLNQSEKQENAELEQLNSELARSLNRCRKLLFDCRSQLAANCNMPELLDDASKETSA
jgi:hypothetical protein